MPGPAEVGKRGMAYWMTSGHAPPGANGRCGAVWFEGHPAYSHQHQECPRVSGTALAGMEGADTGQHRPP